jgi:hypothetical protein
VPLEWAKVEFKGEWRGLYKRTRDIPDDHLYAATARNVYFFGGALSKRGNFRMWMGWSAWTPAGWANAFQGTIVGAGLDFDAIIAGDVVLRVKVGGGTETRIVVGVANPEISVNGGGWSTTPAAGDRFFCTRLFPIQGHVIGFGTHGKQYRVFDGEMQFFVVGDKVRVTSASFGNVLEQGVISAIDVPNDEVSIAGLTDTIDDGGFFVRSNVADYDQLPILTLHQAAFRDGTSVLLGYQFDSTKLGPIVYEFTDDMAGQPRRVPARFPFILAVAWANGLSGTVNTIETIRPGDIVTLTQGGVAGGGSSRTVVSVTPGAPPTLTVTPAFLSVPAANDKIYLLERMTTLDAFPGNDPATFAQFANAAHITFEDLPPAKYYQQVASDGYVLQRNGIVRPTSVATLAAGAAGSLNGVYNGAVTFRNSVTGQESLAGGTGSVVPVNQQINWSNIPVSPDPQVDRKRLYRTQASGGIFFLVTDIPAATTTYVDDFPDVLISANRTLRLALDTPMPSALRVVTLWPAANRLVGLDLGHNAVVFSDQGDLQEGFLKAESWPTTNQVFVSYDDGDTLIGIASFFDSLLVFKRHSIWRILGTPGSLQVEPVSFHQDRSGFGALSHHSIVMNDNEVVFFGSEGAYLINRYQGVQEGFQSYRLSRPIDELYPTLQVVQNQLVRGQAKPHAMFFRTMYQMRAWLPGNLVYQFDGGVFQYLGQSYGQPFGWSQWDFDNSVMPVTASANYVLPAVGLSVVALTDAVGSLDDHAYADFGFIVVPFDYQTVAFPPAGYGIPSRTRAVDLVDRPITDHTLTLSIDGDFAAGVTTVNVPFIQAAVDKVQPVLWLARATWHQLRVQESGSGHNFRLQNIAYWFQALPKQAGALPILQANPSYP